MELKIPERRVMTTESTGQPTFNKGALSGEAIGMQKAGGEVAKMGVEIYEKAQAAERTANAANAVNQYRLEMEQYVSDRSQNAGDYAAFEKDTTEKHKEIFDKIIDDLDDEVTKSSVSTKLGQLGTDYQLKSRLTARKQQIGFAQASTTSALNSMSRLAVEADNDISLNRQLEEIKSLLDVQTNAGIYTPDKAAKLFDDTRNDVYASRISRDMAEDPEQTYHDLLDATYYPDLPEDKRAILTERARKRMETKAKADERARKKSHSEEDRLLRIRQDKTAGEGYSMLQNGELDDVWLEKMRETRSLTATSYEKLKDALNKAEKAGGVTDPDKYFATVNQAYGGALTLDMLYSMVGEGLTYDDVKEIQTIVQEGSPIFKSKDYQEARSYVRESMGITGFGFMKKDDGPKVASASRELYERVKNGANPMEAADDIVARYNKRAQGLPSRRAYPDLTREQLRNMMRANMISMQEYNTEVELITQDEKRAARQAAQAAKPKVTE
jgi:hypothetical protein